MVYAPGYGPSPQGYGPPPQGYGPHSQGYGPPLQGPFTGSPSPTPVYVAVYRLQSSNFNKN